MAAIIVTKASSRGGMAYVPSRALVDARRMFARFGCERGCRRAVDGRNRYYGDRPRDAARNVHGGGKVGPALRRLPKLNRCARALGATGENSDPSKPGAEVRENSWATGTNPAVKSLYLRILARNPKIKGRNVNLAEGGATADELVFQAEEAVELEPQPDLIVIQIGDADIVCPLSPDDLRAFRSTFEAALAVLVKGTPSSRLFVVSQFGSPSPAKRRREHAGGRSSL